MMTNRVETDGVYRGYPNQVQLGINDTTLTLAIVTGDFKAAEKIILENSEEGYLNEGPFEKIPLALVLSPDVKLRKHPRHLRLAKLLAERGADVNRRIPQSEWRGATPSPLQYLVELCRDVGSYNETCERDNSAPDDFETVSVLYTIGIHDEEKLTAYELKEQLLELLDIFLACGGNPNVTTPLSNSSLYHIIFTEHDPDVNLVMKLCEGGGNLNQSNVHGTTPLMELITNSCSDTSQQLLWKILEKQPDVSFDLINCSNETALWRAMHSNSPQLSIELLEKGADPAPRAIVSCAKLTPKKKMVHLIAREVVKFGLSAVFSPLLQNSVSYKLYARPAMFKDIPEDFCVDFHIDLFNKVCATALYPVIDNSYFSKSFPEKVLLELKAILEGETKYSLNNLVPPGMKEDDVPVLMFGNFKAGLQQLCIREIIKQVFFEQSPKSAKELLEKLDNNESDLFKEEENWDEESLTGPECQEKDCTLCDIGLKITPSLHLHDKINFTLCEDYPSEWEIAQRLTPSAVQCLVQNHLNLPSVFIPRFQIEAVRLQIGLSLFTLESIDCLQGCEGESDASSEGLFDDDDYDDDVDVDDDISSSWGSELDSGLVFEYCFDFKEQFAGWGSGGGCSDDGDDDDDDDDDDDGNENSDGDDNENSDGDDNENSDGDDNENSDDDDLNKFGDLIDYSDSENDIMQFVTTNVEDNCNFNEESNGSGDPMPQEICRKYYEAFDNDLQCSDNLTDDEDN